VCDVALNTYELKCNIFCEKQMIRAQITLHEPNKHGKHGTYAKLVGD
jgi:hypothetical protein